MDLRVRVNMKLELKGLSGDPDLFVSNDNPYPTMDDNLWRSGATVGNFSHTRPFKMDRPLTGHPPPATPYRPPPTGHPPLTGSPASPTDPRARRVTTRSRSHSPREALLVTGLADFDDLDCSFYGSPRTNVLRARRRPSARALCRTSVLVKGKPTRLIYHFFI